VLWWRAQIRVSYGSRAYSKTVIREIVEKIVVHPRGPNKPVDLEIFGQPATILKLSDTAAGMAAVSEGAMVAGTSNHRDRHSLIVAV
jgi:hypothetical protein